MKKEEIASFYLKYRIFIFPGVVALSSLILIILIIIPQIFKLISNQNKEGDLISKSKFLEVKAQALENYDINDLSSKASIALSSYPADKDFSNVIGLIQNLTLQSGFSIISMNLATATTKTAGSEKYNIELSLTGPRLQVEAFLSAIEGSTRLMKVSSIDIANTIDPQIVNLSLNLDILFGPLPSSFGSADSPLPELSSKKLELLAKLTNDFTPVASLENIELPARGKANPFE